VRAIGALLSGVLAAAALTPACAADLPLKAPPAVGSCVPAVDGFNGKIGAYGGSLNSDSLYGGTGSLALPLACEFGAQIDGNAASFDGRFLGTIAGHLFWRNPMKGLLGVYGSYTDWDRAGGVRAAHLGAEGEWYFGQWTLQGVAGAEFGNSTSETIGTQIFSYDVKTRFFDQINLAYYVQDNLKLYAGHRYLYGMHAAALGGEWGFPLGHGVMGALFAEGRIGQDDFKGIWGGVRFYFGQKDKTLIRRHREDDPIDWEDGFGIGNTGSTSSVPTTCQPGFILVNGVCEGL